MSNLVNYLCSFEKNSTSPFSHIIIKPNLLFLTFLQKPAAFVSGIPVGIPTIILLQSPLMTKLDQKKMKNTKDKMLQNEIRGLR